MPFDLKYGHITVEHGSIPEDEPVILFRARDALLPLMLYGYAIACEQAGSPPFHVAAIDAASRRIGDWQRANPEQVQTPMSQGYQQRKETEE